MISISFPNTPLNPATMPHRTCISKCGYVAGFAISLFPLSKNLIHLSRFIAQTEFNRCRPLNHRLHGRSSQTNGQTNPKPPKTFSPDHKLRAHTPSASTPSKLCTNEPHHHIQLALPPSP
jgi:hypothetical protein